MLCTSSSYCYIICCDLQLNTDSDHNQLITSCDLYLLKLGESMLMLIKQIWMFSTTKKFEYFRVVDDHSGDQRSQLIVILYLILISVITIHVTSKEDIVCFYLSVTNQNL
jgi:hypothetical protein